MINVREISSKRELNQFINLPWNIYRNDKIWIPQLKSDLRRKLNKNLNPFFEYGQVKSFGAFNDSNKMVGRISSIVNPKYKIIHNENSGFFGLFECIDDKDVCAKLFSKVKEHLISEGCENIIGQVNFTMNDEAGFLLNGYDSPPMIMSNYCPQYYHSLLIENGFEKEIDLLSFKGYTDNVFPEKYKRIVNKLLSSQNITLHSFDPNRYDEQVTIMTSVYNESFKNNYGFVTLSKSESVFLTKQFLPIADNKLIWFVKVDDIPAGFILGLPNINEILRPLNGRVFTPSLIPFLYKKNKIQSYRVLVLCVLPEFRGIGLESILIYQLTKHLYEKPYAIGEFSMVLENNTKMIRVLESIGLRVCKKYRIYTAIL